MSWKTIRADEFCESVRDGTHDTPKPNETGYKLVTGKHVKNGQIDPSDAYYISEKDYKKINERSLVEQWDVLMSMIGTVGEVAVVKDHPNYAIKNVALFKCGGSELKGKWLAYYLRSSDAQGHMSGNQKGSSQQFLSLNQLRSLPIPITDERYMQRVIDILSAYDELIENNQKQIKLLEEAAQRLYKEWFVDLRFPGHETTPIVDGVPEGWKQLALEQITPILTGKKDANFSTEDGRYPFFTCAQAPLRAPSYSFDCNAVILAGNGDFNVKLYRGKFEAYQRTYVLSPECTEYLYLLYHAVNNSMVKLSQAASGSTIKFLTKGMIASIPVYTPEVKNLEKFNTLSEAIQKQIEVLKKSIANATEARNRLLPKLMSGEIEV